MRKLFTFLVILIAAKSAFAYDYPSLTYNFVAGQLISAAKIMQNYNDAINAFSAGTYKANFAEVYIADSLCIDDDKDITAKNYSGTGTVTVSGNVTTLGEITGVTLNAITLAGKITGGANEIEGSNFDIDGGSIDDISTFNVNCDIINADTYDLSIDNAVLFWNAGQDKLLINNSDATDETYIAGYAFVDVEGTTGTKYFRGGQFDGDAAVLLQGSSVSGDGELLLKDVSGPTTRWLISADSTNNTDSYFNPTGTSGFVIGNTATTYDFDVQGSANFTAGVKLGDSQWLGLGSAAANIHFDDESTDELILDATLVGINNETPAKTLDVTGTGEFSSNLTIGGAIDGTGTAGGTTYLYFSDADANIAWNAFDSVGEFTFNFPGGGRADIEVDDIQFDDASGDIVTASVSVNSADGNFTDDVVITDRLSVSGMPRCRAYISGATGDYLLDNVETAVTFNAETFDTDSIHDTATNSERFTVDEDGVYFFSGNIEVTITADASTFRVRVKDNSGAVWSTQENDNSSGAANTICIGFSGYAVLSASDYLYVTVQQNSGNNENLNTGDDHSFFQIVKLH